MTPKENRLKWIRIWERPKYSHRLINFTGTLEEYRRQYPLTIGESSNVLFIDPDTDKEVVVSMLN